MKLTAMFTASYVAIFGFGHLPDRGALHRMMHKCGLTSGLVFTYRGIDEKPHQGFFCTSCNQLVDGEVPAKEPLSKALMPMDARVLLKHSIYNSQTWQNKFSYINRLAYISTPEYDDRVLEAMLKMGYRRADIAKDPLQQYEEWLYPQQ